MDSSIKHTEVGLPANSVVSSGGFRMQTIMFCVYGLLFVLVSCGVALVEYFGVPLFNIESEYQARQRESLQQFEHLADQLKEILQERLENVRDEIAIIGTSPFMRYLPDLKSNIEEQRNLSKNPVTVWRRVARSRADELLTAYLDSVNDRHEIFARIDLVDMDTLTVIVSTSPDKLGSIVKLTEPPADLFWEMHMPDGQREQSADSSPTLVASSLNRSTKLITRAYVPVRNIIEHARWGQAGLGDTGEVILLNQDAETLNDLRHPLPDGSLAPPFGYSIQADPARKAVSGGEGIVRSLDYRGVEVLAAYRYMPIGLNYGWGMVVKQDLAEVLAPYYQSVYRQIVLLASSLIALLVISYFVASRLSHPIEKLNDMTRKVTEGDFDIRAVPLGSTETRGLAETFNTMVKRLEESSTEQERKISLRTTELRQRNSELANAMERLEDSQRRMIETAKLSSLGTLMGGIAHEMNNPLMGVMLYLEYAESRIVEPKIKDILSRAGREADRLKHILNTMTEYLGDVAEEAEPVSVNQVVTGVINLVAADFRHAGIDIEMVVPHSIPDVHISKAGLHQIVLNLLLNAYHAVKDQQIRWVQVSAREESGQIRIEIMDSGPGVSREFHGKIFDPFFTTRAVGEGTGLGLYVSKNIAEHFDGSLSEIAAEGEGAIFRLMLEQYSDVGEE